MSLGVQLAERGWVPDLVLWHAMQRQCGQRLREEDRGSAELNLQRKRELVERLRSSPIALVPEKANEQHYELPPSFFGRVLGPHRKYSCCLWKPETTSLAEAEDDALAVTCERAEIQDGQRILELGCGWGSLSLWMADRYPNAQITAVSNSVPQKSYIDGMARARGLRNLRVITSDMNSFQADGEFDRVVSVEMFEHMRNYEELLARIASWLKPDGLLFVHWFAHREIAYEFEAPSRTSSSNGTKAGDWMSQHFFTGGIMPSDDLLSYFQRDMELVRQWRWSGLHYEKTALSWLANLDAKRRDVRNEMAAAYGSMQADLWLQRWRMFFLACAALFGYRGGEEWGVSHYLMRRAPSNSQT